MTGNVESLDKLGRANPSIWSKYATANLTIKVLRDRAPSRLFHHLLETFTEKRAPEVIKFYDKSKKGLVPKQ